MLRLFTSCLFFLICVKAAAQNLYMPRNIAQAYKNETRSLNGRPGGKYWQNYGRYNISIAAQPPNRTITGKEQIVYYNRSPNSVNELVIRMVLNAHRAGAARMGATDSNYLTSGVQIDSFAVNGNSQTWKEDANSPTAQVVQLPGALASGDSVRLNFTWHYEVSKQSGREGMLDSTTFYLAYFYPRVSVYDDYYGWDVLPFTDYQEFYNDFNDYALQVTVPKNYIVWATGDLKNADAVLQPAYSKRLSASLLTDSVVHIATLAELLSKNVTAQNNTNTWQWIATDITDVTVAVSDHYVWDAASVLVDDATQRRGSVQAAFNDTAKDFHQMVAFCSHALSWFSHNLPGVPYPFSKMTAVQGQADMEYPMMINDSHNDDLIFSRFVAEHEIAHTYFPFYMGINESRYAFMDEGWATTFEYLIGTEDLGKQRADGFFKAFRVSNWIGDKSAEEDIPVITPANILTGVAYGNNAYGKPALGYLAMKDMLGDEMFKKCLQEYMDRWHSKHPIPWDFFYTFNDVSGKNLNWFWNNWFFTNGYIDLALQNVVHTKKGNTIYVQNIGGFDAPFDAALTYTDGTTDTLHQTAAVWNSNEKAAAIVVPGNKTVATASISGGIFMDADMSNNVWKMK